MKKVLVTGGSGFIAYHVIENLIKSNFNVTGVDLVDPKNKPIVQNNIENDFPNSNKEEIDYNNLITRLKEIKKNIALLEKTIFK